MIYEEKKKKKKMKYEIRNFRNMIIHLGKLFSEVDFNEKKAIILVLKDILCDFIMY